MNPPPLTIDTTDFTDRQKVIFLTTSVKGMTKLIRRQEAIIEMQKEEIRLLETDRLDCNRLKSQYTQLKKSNNRLRDILRDNDLLK